MVDTKPKRGFIARVEQKKDLSFLVSLNHCHYCDEKLGFFTCGREADEREVIAKVVHSVKKYHVINTDFRCLSVTIPVISEGGMRKVWCPRSFRKIEPSIPPSSDVIDCLYHCPQMGTRYVNKLPEWNAKVDSLVLKFQGERILTASAKNFLLYDERYSKFDFAESQVRQTAEKKKQQTAAAAATASKETFGSVLARRLNGGVAKKLEILPSNSSSADLEAVAGGSTSRPSSSKHRHKSSSTEVDEGGDSSHRSSRSKHRTGSRTRSSEEKTVETTSSTSSKAPRVPSLKLGTDTHKTVSPMNSHRSSDGQMNSHRSSDGSNSICTSRSPPNTGRSVSGEGGLHSSNNSPRREHRASSSRRSKKPPRPRDAADLAILQFGKSTPTRFVLDFKYPLSPIQAFGIALSTFGSENALRDRGSPKKGGTWGDS
eukprot:gene37335-46068_t